MTTEITYTVQTLDEPSDPAQVCVDAPAGELAGLVTLSVQVGSEIIQLKLDATQAYVIAGAVYRAADRAADQLPE